ncbi:MAG: peptide chain release factor 2 [Aeriscardovia sp.]|nr:peptide chain release factor 2 [Aeriscardovia sp.]
MSELDERQKLSQIEDLFASVCRAIDPKGVEKKVKELEEKTAAEDLWRDPGSAQSLFASLSANRSLLSKIEELKTALSDISLMLSLAQEEGDDSLLKEAEKEMKKTEEEISSLQLRSLLNGEYDERNAVVTIRSGAGGNDAADWAQMLLRMYLHWCKKKGYEASLLNLSQGEEGGVKSATFQVKAPYSYGILASEAGTHRLVRISPFDNQGRRHTSFAGVEVIPLVESSDEVKIDEGDLRIDTFQSSGPGGQGVNTTYSAVRITHIPTGIVVNMQDQRSQIQNKALAMQILQSKLLALKKQEESEQRKELAGDVKASWGDQIRSYVFHPYQMVKDLRTGMETSDIEGVMNGEIDEFLSSGMQWKKRHEK